MRHVHGEVLALHIARADIHSVGISVNQFFADADALCGDVAARPADGCTIQLYKLHIVRIGPKARDGCRGL